jgi:hypothetical protein
MLARISRGGSAAPQAEPESDRLVIARGPGVAGQLAIPAPEVAFIESSNQIPLHLIQAKLVTLPIVRTPRDPTSWT